MRYLLNFPLFLAIASTYSVVSLTMLSDPPSGNDAQLGAAFAMVFGSGIAWLMFGVVLIGCAGIGGFFWLPAGSVGAIFIILLVYGAITLAALMPTYINLEASGGGEKFAADQVWLARLVVIGLPIALSVYLAWIINAPAGRRDAMLLGGVTIGAVVMLCLVGSVVAIRENIRWSAVAKADAVVASEVEAERARRERQAFEALTDADPLLSWDMYAGYNVPDDIRIEALRRIAARPTLEADLAEALACENTNWTREALSLIVSLPFAPTAALEQPVGAALSTLSDEIRSGAGHETYDGDKRIDYYEQRTLRATLGVAERMAETAGVDLRDQLDAMQQAVALFPKSDAAHDFPGQVGDAKKRIAKSLAAHHS